MQLMRVADVAVDHRCTMRLLFDAIVNQLGGVVDTFSTLGGGPAKFSDDALLAKPDGKQRRAVFSS